MLDFAHEAIVVDDKDDSEDEDGAKRNNNKRANVGGFLCACLCSKI